MPSNGDPQYYFPMWNAPPYHPGPTYQEKLMDVKTMLYNDTSRLDDLKKDLAEFKEMISKESSKENFKVEEHLAWFAEHVSKLEEWHKHVSGDMDDIYKLRRIRDAINKVIPSDSFKGWYERGFFKP